MTHSAVAGGSIPARATAWRTARWSAPDCRSSGSPLGARPTTGARISPSFSALARRWRCSAARCSSAIRSAAAFATSRSDGSARPTRRCHPRSSSAKALADELAREAHLRPADRRDQLRHPRAVRQACRQRGRLRRGRALLDVSWRAAGGRSRDLAGAGGGTRRGKAGDVLLVRLQRPSEIPIESLFGRKEEIGRTIRADALRRAARASGSASFRCDPAGRAPRRVRAAAPRAARSRGRRPGQHRAARRSGRPGAADVVRRALTLEDLGINVKPSADGTQVIVDTTSGILSPALEGNIRDAGKKLG